MSNYTGAVPAPRRRTDWRDQAACRDEEPELFFDGSEGVEEYAKAVCSVCPVIARCREWALSKPEVYGTWGGLTERERRRILRIRVAEGVDEPRKGGRPRAECGTPSAYDRHIRLGEPVDQRCRAAHAEATRLQKARKRAAEQARSAA